MADIRDAMTPAVVHVGPDHTLRTAARHMAERNVGSAIVLDPEAPGPGIVTERDILRAVAAGVDPATARVGEHHIDNVTVATTTWSLDDAATAMLRGGFRHLLVMEGNEVAGVLSMRDIVRTWTQERIGAM